MKIARFSLSFLSFLAIDGRSQGETADAAKVPAIQIAPVGDFKVKYYGRFSELPVGAVKPLGWIRGWLERQVQGMTGHPENLAYPYDTCMYDGVIPPPHVPHGEIWWPYEQSGYFVDGATRLSFQIDDPIAAKIRETNLTYVLDHYGPGKLGESTWGWPNTVVGRALMAFYGATGNPRAAQALVSAVFASGPKPGRDAYVFEEALFLYGISGDERLLEVAKKAYVRYFFDDPTSFSYVDKLRGPQPLREHGVTTAEQLKLLPLIYAYTGDPAALALAKVAYRKVEQDSLMPDGGIVSSENLAATEFNSLHESCDITDWSWSFGYMLMASGEGHWADRIEQATFNALPGAVTKDFKQVQYFSSANQILASDTASHRYVPTRMSYRAAHDTECCTGNINRAMPNYVARMWMKTQDGLAAVLYGPNQMKTTVDRHPVTITEETEYPFRETITFKINTPEPANFALNLRIPEWCDEASITIKGAPVSAVDVRPGHFMQLKREYRDGDTLVLRLPMKVQPKSWFNGRGVSMQRGPLVYSLKIDEKQVESHQDNEAIRAVLKGNNIEGFPAVEFFPTGEWRYGIESAQLSAPENFRVVESSVAENPFLAENVPVRIEVPVRFLPQWEASWNPLREFPPGDFNRAPKNPVTLPSEVQNQPEGETKTMTFVPYGATYLRLTTLPVIGAPLSR